MTHGSMKPHPRIHDYDGAPHNAGTGARVAADNEPAGHWIDGLPTTPMDGLTLVTKPSDMVMAPDGVWMRRDEFKPEEWPEERVRAATLARRQGLIDEQPTDRELAEAEPVEQRKAS